MATSDDDSSSNLEDTPMKLPLSTPDQNCTERRRESAPFGWIWPE